MFPPFARQPVCHKVPCHRTNRRHQGVVKPQLFFPCGQEDRQHVHASRQRDDGVVEESEGNKTHATELVDPVLNAARYRGRRARNSLVNEHFRTRPTSILACETRKLAILRGRPLRFAVLFGGLHSDWRLMSRNTLPLAMGVRRPRRLSNVSRMDALVRENLFCIGFTIGD